MRRAILTLSLLCSLLICGLAAPSIANAQSETGAPAPTPAPTPTPTPTLREACLDNFIPTKCFGSLWENFGWWAIGVMVLAAGGLLLWAFLKGFSEESGKQLVPWLSAWLSDRLSWRRDPGRDYLRWFITQYRDPKFGPLHLGVRFKQDKPARLEDIYLPVEVAFDLTTTERAAQDKRASRLAPEKEGLATALGKQDETIGLFEAFKRSPRALTVIGIAGSGKSTLLQWLGLCNAHALLGKKIPGSKELFKAFGAPLWPIFTPLGAFDHYCQQHERARTAAALLDFMTVRYQSLCESQTGKRQAPALPPDFFERALRRGCLLLFDGVDEVERAQRPAVRQAVQELLEIYTHARTRALITARFAAAGEAQLEQARRGQVLPLDEAHRDGLVRKLYGYYEEHQAESRSADLIQRLAISDERVQKLAETPLLTTIFVIIHRPGHELPDQRAEVYDRAVETLLSEIHRKDAAELGELRSTDAADLRSKLARVAFQLHLAGRGEDGLPESDLIAMLLPDFPTVATGDQERRAEIRAFLYNIAYRGGLLEEQDCAFAFRTHRSFQEFLAGWHLVRNYAPSDLKKQGKFITDHLTEDAWVEPVRLAAGYLAISGGGETNVFVENLASLGRNHRERDFAAALAGLCLSDLAAKPDYRPLRESLPGRMLAVIERQPPSLPLRLRFDVGLAVANLKDPAEPRRSFDNRLRPGKDPALVSIPAGPFRMGSNPADQAALTAAGVQAESIWDDEKTAADYLATLSAYEIGKYPVTNAEYAAFANGAKGYENESLWSAAGWQWRTGEWKSDLSIYSEEYQKDVQRWLERRPPARRDQPFWWDDRRWNAANLPVVGVCWFEAEAYCMWLSAVTGQPYRLPSEAEWEKAARWQPPEKTSAEPSSKLGQSRLWPWGDAWDATKCNNAEPADSLGRTSPIGIYPDGASPLGARDMAGNVWEWCWDWFDPQAYQQIGDLAIIDPHGPDEGKARALRGGSWYYYRDYARCAARGGFVPDYFHRPCRFPGGALSQPVLNLWLLAADFCRRRSVAAVPSPLWGDFFIFNLRPGTEIAPSPRQSTPHQ